MRYMEEIAMQCNAITFALGMHIYGWMDGYKHTQCVARKY
jgi:hypothetical protein